MDPLAFDLRNAEALLFDDALGSGFVTEANRNSCDCLRISELSDGFEPLSPAEGLIETRLVSGPDGIHAEFGSGGALSSDCGGALPLTFAVKVPHRGNYKVHITLTAFKPAEFLIFLSRRRLAAGGSLGPGETFEGSFPVNVSPIIPRTFSAVMEDTTVSVTVIGSGVCLTSLTIEESSLPTIYIAGDSTVTDQSAGYPYLPGRSYSGWGQMLSAFITSHAVSNHAHSGLTTESFRSEGHYAIVEDNIQAGDICLFQFAHNDQKLDFLKAGGGYRDRLTAYIDDMRRRKAIPVIISPLARNSWKGDGSYNDLLADYAEECRMLCAEKKVPFVDLHAFSLKLVTGLGLEAAKKYYFPSDYTHSNDFGAYLFAGFIASQLAGLGLVKALPAKDWNPPAVPGRIEIPQGFTGRAAAEDLFAGLERPDDFITRAEALEFVIRGAKYFPTNVYNDMYPDLVGHETYAGSVECAYQNGIIPEAMTPDGLFHPQSQIREKELYSILSLAFFSRKGSPDIPGIPAPEEDPEAFVTRRRAADMCSKINRII